MTIFSDLNLEKKKGTLLHKINPMSDALSKQEPFLSFVVQEHAASHLHYDFRLEMEGVLKSWAIPKGPSMDPSKKRLAIETQDHPLSYENFEGLIPQGRYGSGTVLLWDQGTYTNLSKDSSILEDYNKGHLVIFLKGTKLKGEFILQRLRPSQKGLKKQNQWLFIKGKDAYAHTTKDILENDKSVFSGKTIKELERQGD